MVGEKRFLLSESFENTVRKFGNRTGQAFLCATNNLDALKFCRMMSHWLALTGVLSNAGPWQCSCSLAHVKSMWLFFNAHSWPKTLGMKQYLTSWFQVHFDVEILWERNQSIDLGGFWALFRLSMPPESFRDLLSRNVCLWVDSHLYVTLVNDFPEWRPMSPSVCDVLHFKLLFSVPCLVADSHLGSSLGWVTSSGRRRS